LERLARWILVAVLGVVALNAFGGGYYGMAGARDVPVEWLAGSPFSSYFVPSLVLFVVVGGSCLVAAVAVVAQHRLARRAAMTSGLILIAWILAQMSIIGYVSWLQPAMLAAGALMLLLATRFHPRFTD
jgi:hypothetical protein